MKERTIDPVADLAEAVIGGLADYWEEHDDPSTRDVVRSTCQRRARDVAEHIWRGRLAWWIATGSMPDAAWDAPAGEGNPLWADIRARLVDHAAQFCYDEDLMDDVADSATAVGLVCDHMINQSGVRYASTVKVPS